MINYRLLGRYMDGTNVVAYELQSNSDATRRKVSREQMILFVGKGIVPGVKARCYQDKVLLEAEDGYPNISDLPAMNINNGNMRGVPSVGNRRIKQDFDTCALVGRINNERAFVVQSSYGYAIVDSEKLTKLAMDGKVVNARVQNYKKDDGRSQRIIRLSTGQKMSELPVYDRETVMAKQ